MKLTDWELEDYLVEHRKDLYRKLLNGALTFDQIRKITGIGKRGLQMVMIGLFGNILGET